MSLGETIRITRQKSFYTQEEFARKLNVALSTVCLLYTSSDPAFAVNTEYLKKAQPKDLDASEIDVRLGATWVNRDYICLLYTSRCV